jgi:5-formyltetrahydrofolate cyclo-ligase
MSSERTPSGAISVSPAGATKSELRAAALERRNALSAAERQAASRAIASRRFPVPLGEGTVVAGYSPIRSECDPVPLMRSLAAKGAQLALPVVEGEDKPLTFAEWHQGSRLVAGPYGILQPAADALVVDPDIVLVPLAAFDRGCRRIGYGVGYYDRTLVALRARKVVVAVGIAFAAQEVACIAAAGHDAHLDLVLTEREVIDPRAASSPA